ncbi:Thiol:disulfide interchange protein DsbC [uncultured Gammaproteobacteria bacterium]|jgi:thiol:disulfide interchange protein DsbC|nr:Thiol:disulfide interchange protein DsbC [uncultured Gammaproteobacteria bacterium]VVH65251.1 Thiol:disulfide interchange protein DsbC [uncultured Gammaproteobacteria bacterium]
MFKLLFVVSLLITNTSFANKADIADGLKRFFGEVKHEDIVKTPFNGVYEVILHNPIDSLFVSADGKYLIKGDVLNLETLALLKPSTRVNALKQSLTNTIADKDKIIYPANKEKYVVHVFTDVDCPFCKRLHAQVPKMNELGITVKYLASPIASLHPKAQGKMEKIWCAKDKVKAMDDYQTKNIVPNSSDCANPIKQQLKLSQQLGVRGTPAIFLSDGTHLPGYLSATKLLKTIKQRLGK